MKNFPKLQRAITLSKYYGIHSKVNQVIYISSPISIRNQRTSGLVNAHLTPGPGIYFNAFIHVYSPRARAKKPLGTNFWCQQKALITLTICFKFQTNLFEFWFYTHFLMFFHMYIAPGQGQTTFCRQYPDVNRKALSLCPFVASFKKISLISDFIHNFSCFYICIWPRGKGRQPLGVRIFILT